MGEIRVLQVDDDEAFRELSVAFLEREGFEVVTAAAAAAGLERLDDDIDCVVSDYEMPGRDGLAFLDAVRGRYPELPFILFTGKGSEEIASEAIRSGVTDYLQKTTSGEGFTLLANRIEHAVTERRAEDALAESERMLSTLVSNPPRIVYRCRNADGWPMEYLGGNVEETTGYDASELLDGDVEWDDLIDHPDDAVQWNRVQEAIEHDEPFEVTYRIVDADGDRRWIRDQGRGVPTDDGDTAADAPAVIEGFINEITAEKRRERVIAEYDRLVDALGDPVYTTDPDGVFTTFNERAEERLGYDTDELVGEHVSVLIDDEEIEQGMEIIRKLLRDDDRSTATYDVTVRTADGGRIELENHVALLTFDGEFRGTVGVLRDTADRPTARLRRLHEATRELMAETDPDAIAELTTQAARDVLDIPMSSIRFAVDDTLEVAALAADTDSVDPVDRTPYRIDGTVPGRVFREGDRHVVSTAAAMAEMEERDGIDRGPAKSSAYVPLGDHGVFSIAARTENAFDETDIQLATVLAANAEAALDRANKGIQLRRERDDFAALFENIPDPTVEVLMRDTEPIVTRVNPAFERTFGYSADEIRGDNLDEYVIPDDPAVDIAQYNRRIQRGETLHDEVRRVTADGIRDFIIHIVPHDVGEEATRGYAIYTDITDRKERERELERQNERLDEFASVVSHDLRNPLSVARGHLELARSADGDAAEHFESIEAAHERMDELINRLLAFARQGEPATSTESLSLESAARDAWETVQTDALSLVVDADRDVRADRDRLRQLLENLFRNSVEHGIISPDSQTRRDTAERGSASPRSQAHEHAASRVTVGPLDGGFYVEDDGPGIPESEREAVLRSGYSGSDGTGFGLSIVEAVAEAHGWELAVTESEAGGARFEFRADRR